MFALTPEEARLLLNVALMATGQNRFRSAAKILAALGAIPRFPDAAMLKAFKGMALLRMGRTSEARIPLEEAANQSADPAAAQLAKDLLT